MDERWPLEGGNGGARERYRVSPPPRRVAFDDTMRIDARPARGRRGGRSAVDVLPPRNAPGAANQRELDTRAALVATAVAAVVTEPDAPSCLDVDDAVLETAATPADVDEQQWTPPQLLTSALTDPAVPRGRAGRHARPKERTTNWRGLGLGALGAGCTALLVAALFTTLSEPEEPGTGAPQAASLAGIPDLGGTPSLASVEGLLELTGAELVAAGQAVPEGGAVGAGDPVVLRLSYEYEAQEDWDTLAVVWYRGDQELGRQSAPLIGGEDAVEVPAPAGFEPGGDYRAELVFNDGVSVYAVPFTVQP